MFLVWEGPGGGVGRALAGISSMKASQLLR